MVVTGLVSPGRWLVLVGTRRPHAAHRRRGLAGYLLGVASAWACERGARQLVIVAESGSAAERLYEAVGFRPVARGFGAYAAPAGG